MKTNKKIKAVVNEPLFSGDNKPIKVNVKVVQLIQINCIPVPRKTLKRIEFEVGGRKMSP